LLIDCWIQAHQEQEFMFPLLPNQSREIVQKHALHQGIPNNDAPPPMAPPMPVHQMDLSIIQALGRDNTTLDDQEDLTISEPLDTDEEGCDTDRSDEASQTPPLHARMPLADTVTSTADSDVITPQPILKTQLGTDHRTAIVQQVQQRVEYEIGRLLPSLYGLQNLVADTPELRTTKSIHELCQVMQLLSTRLETNNTELPAPKSTVLLDGDGLNTVRKCDHRVALLPPSPELRQKRKDSHAPF
jgi:hypothetical protein